MTGSVHDVDFIIIPAKRSNCCLNGNSTLPFQNHSEMCIRDRLCPVRREVGKPPPALLDGHTLPQQKGRKFVKAASLGKCLPYRPAQLRLVRFILGGLGRLSGCLLYTSCRRQLPLAAHFILLDKQHHEPGLVLLCIGGHFPQIAQHTRRQDVYKRQDLTDTQNRCYPKYLQTPQNEENRPRSASHLSEYRPIF